MREYNPDSLRRNGAVDLMDVDTSYLKKKYIKRLVSLIVVLAVIFIGYGVVKKYQYSNMYSYDVSQIVKTNDKKFYYYGHVNPVQKLAINSTYYGMSGIADLGTIDNIEIFTINTKVQAGKAKLLIMEGDNNYKLLDLKSGETKIKMPTDKLYKVYFVGDYFFGTMKLTTANH